MTHFRTSLNTVLSNRNLLAVTVTQSLSMFAMFLWRPFWGLYILELDGTKSILGALTALQSLSVLLAQLLGGVLSDRVGRKRIIILSQFAVSTSSLGYILSSGFSGVALTRFMGGLGEGLGGNVMGATGGPVWQALVTEIAPAETRGSILGLMGTLIGFLTTPAPILGGYLYENASPRLPFIASFISGILGCLVFSLWVREPERATREA